MRWGFRAASFSVLIGFLSGGSVWSQVSVPPNPGKASVRKLGENGGSSASAGVTPAPKPLVIQIVAVTPVEAWVNLEGKTMMARLIAFSAPAPGAAGPVELIRNGKVRFLVEGSKDPLEYPLVRLREAEQSKIKALAAVAAKGPPP